MIDWLQLIVGFTFAMFVLWYIPTMCFLIAKMATIGYYVGRSFVEDQRRKQGVHVNGKP